MKIKLNILKIAFVFSFSVVLLSCASKKNVEINMDQIETTPKIVFLNYVIEKKLDGTKSIEYLDKIVTKGKLKSFYKNTTEVVHSGDLRCLQLDKNTNILFHTIIKNPLVKTIEYPNDSLSFQTKSIDLNRANFTIRMQLETNTKYIRIFEIDEKKSNLRPLITTKLN